MDDAIPSKINNSPSCSLNKNEIMKVKNFEQLQLNDASEKLETNLHNFDLN